MDAIAGLTCNAKGSPKGPLSNIEDGLEQSVSEQTKERIGALLERIESLSDVEKLLLYLKLPTGSASEDVLRQTPTSCLYASNRLEQAQAFTWIRSHLEEDSQICVPKHEVYDDYRLYCDSHRLKPLCPADFGKVLKCIFPNVKPRRLGQRGQSRYCYSGLRKKLDVQPPSLPDLEVSPKKPKREELQESEMMSASCQLVCEWAGRLLSRTFGGVGELAEFLVGNLYVNSKSTAAFTVLAALQDTAVNTAAGGGGGVCPLLSSSSGGDRHRETQLQLQRKLQERELLKEQKKKLQQQRSEIQQQQQQQQQQLLLLRGGGATTTPTPTPTPTPSPQPRTFSKTPTPLRSPVGGRPPSSCLKSPTPTLSFRAGGKGPTARNITRLLQSPLPKPSPHPFPPTKADNPADAGFPEGGKSESGVGGEGSAWSSLQTATTTTTITATTTTTTAMAAFNVAGHRLQKPVVMSRNDTQPAVTMTSSKDSGNPMTMSATVTSLPRGPCVGESSSASVLDKVGGLSTSLSPFSSIAASVSDSATFSRSSAVSRTTHLLSGSGVDSGVGGTPHSGPEGCGSVEKAVTCTWAGVVTSTPAALTFMSGAESSSSEQSSTDVDTIIVSTSDPASLPGNMSARSAFVPVTNQKQSFTLMATSSSTAVCEGSSSEESKDTEDGSGDPSDGVPSVDQSESAPLHQRQSDSLSGSGGFPPHAEVRGEGSWSGMPRSETSQNGGGRKGKNRFTPIRPKAPQPHPSPAKEEGVGGKDRERCRPVSALLKEKRAREAQEVLQHLASSFHHHHQQQQQQQHHTATTTPSSLPSTLTLPAEVLGLSGERGPGGGNEVVIILTSPSSSSSGASQRAGVNARLPPAEEKGWRAGCVARSMSDILIANPNFLQQKVAPPPSTTTAAAPFTSTTTTTSNNNISSSSNSGVGAGEKARTPVTSELGVVATAASAQDSSENWETGNMAADEEVTRHMTNAAHASSHARPGARTPGSHTPTRHASHTPTPTPTLRTKTPTLTFRTTPTPTVPVATTRKRKLEHAGEGTPFVKRSASHSQEVVPHFLGSARSSAADDPGPLCMLLESDSKPSAHDTPSRAEDDDVFILDLPTSVPKSESQGHQWVRPEGVGRAARRSDVVSPYPRPHSSTPLHMQMDRPVSRGHPLTAGLNETVSRCQSTGIELNEVMTRCLSTGIPGEDRPQKGRPSQAEDPGCLIAGKLNLESMESDALLDMEVPPPSQIPLMLQGSAVAGSSRGMGDELAAAQRALLREKQLLDARFHSFWTRLRSMDAVTPAPTVLGMAGSAHSSGAVPASQGMPATGNVSRQEDVCPDVFSSTPSFPTSAAVSFALETTSQSGGQVTGLGKPEQAGFPSSGALGLPSSSEAGMPLGQATAISAEEQLPSVHLYPSDHSPQQVQAYPNNPFLMSPAGGGQLLADSLLVQAHSQTGSVPVHSDSSVGLNSSVMTTTAGEEEKETMVGDERVSMDTFPMAASSFRTQTAVDASSVMMEANSFGLDTTAAFGMDSNPFGMDSTPLSVDTNALGMDTTPLGMDTNALGMDTNALGMDTTPLGMDPGMLGVDANPLSLDSSFDAGSWGLEAGALSIDSNPRSVDSDTLSMAADHFVQLVQGLVSTQDTSPSQLPHVSSVAQPLQGLSVAASTPLQPLQGPVYPSSQAPAAASAVMSCVGSSSVTVHRVSSMAVGARSRSGDGGGDASLGQQKASQALPPSGRSKSSSSEVPASRSDVVSIDAPAAPNAPSRAVKAELEPFNARSRSTGGEVQPSAKAGVTPGGQSKARSHHPPPPNTLLALLKSPVLSAISTPGGSTSRVWAGKAPPSLPTPSPLTTVSGQETFTPNAANSRPSFSAATSSSLFVRPAVSHVAVSSVVECATSVASLAPVVTPMPGAAAPLQTPQARSVVRPQGGESRSQGVPATLSTLKEKTDTVGGELPLDVADFVTEHRLKVELQQQLQQRKQQQQQQQLQLLQQQQKQQQSLVWSVEAKDSTSATLLTDKELAALLLTQSGTAALLTHPERESIRLAAARTQSAPLLQWSDPKTPLPVTSSALTVTLAEEKNPFPVPSSPAPKQRLSESGSAGLKKHASLQRSASLPLSTPSPTRELASLVAPIPVSSPSSHDPVTSRRQAAGSGGVNGAVSKASSRESVTSPVCVSVVSPAGEGGVSSVSSFVPIQGSPVSRGVGSRPLRPALTVPVAGGHRVVQASSAPLTLVGIERLTMTPSTEAHNDTTSMTRPLTSSPRPGTAAYSAPSSHPARVSPGPSPTPPASHAYSPSPTPASQRAGGGGQGVLQQLLSARGAPPSYAQTLQQRLLSSAMLSTIPLIRGAAQGGAGSTQTVAKLMDSQQAARSGAESSVLVSVASLLAEDVKPVAKALVHHIPCPSPSPPGKDASPAPAERSPAPSIDRSPASTYKDRSPASTYKDRSPASSYKDRSPASTYKDRSPASTYKDRSPLSGHKDRSPAPSRAERSPASNPKDRSPAFLSKDRSPAGERSPASSHGEKAVCDKPLPQKEKSGRRASGQRRESAGRSRLPSAAKLPPGVVAASDSRVPRNASNPASPTDAGEYSRPFSHKLQLLKQHVAADRGHAGVVAIQGLQGGAVSEVPSSPAALSPSGGRGVGGALSVAVSSPATPGSLSSSAPSPASQGQGQGSGVADVFFSVPPASPAPSPRVMPAFSPQQLSSSSSSSSSSSTTQATLYLPFNLPDMNYMGSAPNIDLSQLLPAATKTSPLPLPPPTPASSSVTSVLVGGDAGEGGLLLHSLEDHSRLSGAGGGVDGRVRVLDEAGRGCGGEERSVSGGETGGGGLGQGGGSVLTGGGGVGPLQTLEELQSTLEILQGMDSHYFSSAAHLQGHDLLHNVLGHFTSDLHSPPAQEEDGKVDG